MTIANTLSKCAAATALIAALGAPLSPAHAQVPLSAHADAKGFVDMQALTCAQLANSFQEEAGYLAAMRAGWSPA
jgi:hypothetical protein